MVNICDHVTLVDLIGMEKIDFNVVMGMNWLVIIGELLKDFLLSLHP